MDAGTRFGCIQAGPACPRPATRPSTAVPRSMANIAQSTNREERASDILKTMDTEPSAETTSAPSTLASWVLLIVLFAVVQFAALFRPPLLDDADANHAEAAQHMAESGDWITLQI